MTASGTDQEARALEAEAKEYPEERGEILLEAAAAWKRAGRADRAEQLLREVAGGEGVDSFFARAELADLLFDDGRPEAAAAELDALARDPELSAHNCAFTAELLAERGDLDEALRWYDRFVARLTPEQLDALRGPNGWMQMESISLRGRQHVREQLGLPPDAMDEIVPVAPADPFGLRLLQRRPPRELRIFTFQRAERAEARRRWPEEYPGPDEEFYPAIERQWREHAESGVPTIRLVLTTVTEFVAFAERVGGSPTDSAIKTNYANSVPDDRTVPWPPERNARCWCGSGAKYKKCCGRP
ncbi:SEC-C domain-containing protein [Pseudonocardia nigra]|uniref:SEC-C domain-containing protein n=1 Tax=Pseudonocardia nigra TaxID=1921578 RepID=UPI001C5CEE8B|nr:SEC-C domain-containing protein [Pseudonocardia nigra]